jgi:hypothetical protein
MHGWYQNEEAQELSAFAEFAYDWPDPVRKRERVGRLLNYFREAA